MTRRRTIPGEPRLEATLLANGSEAARVYRGEPIVLSVHVIDPEAERVAAHNESLEEAREDLEARSAAGDVPDDELAAARAGLRPMKARTMRLGTKQSPWADQVRFSVKDGHGHAVRWPVRVLENPAPGGIVELSPGNVAVADYGVGAPAVDGARKGVYVVRATVAAGSVRVGTDPVEITITREAAPEAQRARVILAVARMAYRTGSYGEAEAETTRALEVDPASIDALVLRADVALAIGRVDAALAALERALEESERQHPDAYEPPGPILRRLARVHRILFPEAGTPDPLEGLSPLE